MARFLTTNQFEDNITTTHVSNNVTSVTASESLDAADSQNIVLSGSTAITLTLPAVNATGVGIGFEWYVINGSSATATINGSTNTAIGTIPAGRAAIIVATVSAAPGTWSLEVIGASATTSIDPFTTTLTRTDFAQSGTFYQATIAKSVHGKGDNPQVSVRDGESFDFLEPGILVEPTGSNAGLVTVRVSMDPDLRPAASGDSFLVVIGGA